MTVKGTVIDAEGSLLTMRKLITSLQHEGPKARLVGNAARRLLPATSQSRVNISLSAASTLSDGSNCLEIV